MKQKNPSAVWRDDFFRADFYFLTREEPLILYLKPLTLKVFAVKFCRVIAFEVESTLNETIFEDE